MAPGYHWNDAPLAVKGQVVALATGLEELLGDRNVGLYLHGSLTFGCFNPDHSDLDLIAVTRSDLSQAEAEALASLCLRLSRQPAPLEFHVLSLADISPWQFPTPFRFHYSEGWRERYEEGRALSAMPAVDPDLAGHIGTLHNRGIVLRGPAISDLFPPIPPADYLASIWDPGVEWMLTDRHFGVLNLCRVLAYVREGRITSKAEGGAWALGSLPVELRPVVAGALALYQGAPGRSMAAVADLRYFAEGMQRLIAAAASGPGPNRSLTES